MGGTSVQQLVETEAVLPTKVGLLSAAKAAVHEARIEAQRELRRQLGELQAHELARLAFDEEQED